MRTKKHFLSFFLATVMIILLVIATSITVSANAIDYGTCPSLIVDNQRALIKNTANDTVTVSLSFANMPKFKTFAIFDLTFDADVLELISFEWKVDGTLKNWNGAKGVLTKDADTDMNGEIAQLTFKVKEGCSNYVGTHDVSCSASARLANGDEVEVYSIVGHIELSDVMAGDLNEDEIVNEDDAIYLLYYTFFPEEYPINQPCDYDSNGVVNEDDAIYVLYYTFFPEEYPLSKKVSTGGNDNEQSISYNYFYSISVGENNEFALYVLKTGNDGTYLLTVKTGEMKCTDIVGVYLLDYSDVNESDEYIRMEGNRFSFCESDGSILIDISIERITNNAVCELVPRKGNNSYGYYDLANEKNGANMQRLYYAMYLDAEAFYNSTSDLDASLEIGSYNIGDYDVTIDEAIAVWKVFYQENPLYYWLSNTIVIYGGQMGVCVDESYKLYADRLTCNENIKAMFDEFNESISDSMSDLEIALAAHDFIVKRINYAYEADGVTPQDDLWAHNIIGTAMKQYGVCESYAKTYMCLCLMNDVDCIVVGGTGNNEDHMWNLVKIDDVWYGVDVTWDETGTDELSYSCFGMSDSALNDAHTADSVTSSGIDYQYGLPRVSEDNIQLVYLYKGEQYLGTFINIDAAFEAMTDRESEYTIELQKYNLQGPLLLASLSVEHKINSSSTPEIKKLTIRGCHTDLGNGYFYTYPLTINGSLAFGSNIDINDIQIVCNGTLDLKGYTLSTYGYRCSMDGDIIGDASEESKSYINAYTTYETDIYGSVNVFGVQCMTYGPCIQMYKSSNIQLASGCIVFFSDSSSSFYIKDYVVHADQQMGNIKLTSNGTSVEIENIVCGRPGEYNYVYILNRFGKLEEFNHLKISGSTECDIRYDLLGEVHYVMTDLFGNEVESWVEKANPENLTVPILNIGDPSILDHLSVSISDTTFQFDELYELLENGDIVRKTEP